MIFVVAGNYDQFTNYRFDQAHALKACPACLDGAVDHVSMGSLRYVGHPRDLHGYRFESIRRRLGWWERVKWFLRYWRRPPEFILEPSPHSVRFVGTWRQRPDLEEILQRLRAGGWALTGPLL